MANFWTYSIDGAEYYDAEFNSSEECIKAMDEHYAMLCEADEIEGAFSCEAEIIRFRYTENGEKEILYSQPVEAEYEYYRGDLEEHGTYH